MKGLMKLISWRFKIGWKCVGGHYIDADGCYAQEIPPTFYRYVWMNRKTHEIRYQDNRLTFRSSL